MTARTLYLPALIVAAVLMACAVVVLALSEKAEAGFPGKNGKIAYSAFDFDGGVDDRIYTIKAGGAGKTKVTWGYQPSYSPDGKKIAYTRIISRNAGLPISDIYTINASGGGGKFPVTHTNALFEIGPSWGSRP